MEINNYNHSLDIIKMICAVLIVASHALPIFGIEVLDIFYGQWFFRFCVPLFFIQSGYYFCKMEDAKKKEYILHIGILYLISSVLYLPFIVFTTDDLPGNLMIINRVNYIIFGWHHLWYLSALFFGLILLMMIQKYTIKEKMIDAIMMLCLGGGYTD